MRTYYDASERTYTGRRRRQRVALRLLLRRQWRQKSLTTMTRRASSVSFNLAQLVNESTVSVRTYFCALCATSLRA